MTKKGPTNGLESRTINVLRDGVGRAHFRQIPETSPRAARFADAQIKVLRGQVVLNDPLANAALWLVLVDGVCTRADLASALMSLPEIYRWKGHVCLEWLRHDGRQDRRFLSPLTANNLQKLMPVVARHDALRAIGVAAAKLYPGREDSIATWLGDAQAWVLDVLPGALSAHALGTNPMTALPHEALVRGSTCNAISPGNIKEESPDGAVALGQAFDVYFNGTARVGSAWLVDQVVVICRRKPNLLESADRKRMLEECLTLSYRARDADPLSALILAWIVDLIESGNVREDLLVPASIDKYVRLAAPLLRIHFGAKDPGEMDANALDVVYQTILNSTSDGQKRTAATALSSWHAFLVQWLDAPPLAKSLCKDLPVSLPRANLIWGHEFATLEKWLEDAKLDERLTWQLRVSFTIAKNARIRAAELFCLRLRSLTKHDDGLEIEVCPMPRDGSLKTPAARRRLNINNTDSQLLLLAWRARREKEGALGDDLLFGDPHHSEQVYQLGKLYVILNLLLKSVTGDVGVSLHTLSHTWISNAVHDCLLGPVDQDINPLDEIAVAAGHRSVQTSLSHYSHRFEYPLRRLLDAGLSRLRLTSAEAEKLSCVGADALRWRTHARKESRQKIYWDAIHNRNASSEIPDVSFAIPTIKPQPPRVLAATPVLRFTLILNALRDLISGKDQAVVAARCARDESWVRLLATETVELLRGLNKVACPSLPRRMSTAEVFHVLKSLHKTQKSGIDFDRAGQAKFRPMIIFLESMSLDDLNLAALNAWQRSFQGHHISFDNADDAGHLFRLLHAANIPSNQLAISIAADDPANPEGTALQMEAELAAHFTRRFGLPPLVEWKSKRRGRPPSFLIWSSIPLMQDASPIGAATSVTGFNAIMLSASAFASMVLENQIKPDQSVKGEGG